MSAPTSKWSVISEEVFAADIHKLLTEIPKDMYDYVTGPGRSGAIAAVYASHILGIPFIPHKSLMKGREGNLLIIDTAKYSGSTLSKARSWNQKHNPSLDRISTAYVHLETKGNYVRYWYEPAGQQSYNTGK